ncbi:MAG: hypothetical protein WDN00_15170 [Limisphaerales bacterium]
MTAGFLKRHGCTSTHFLCYATSDNLYGPYTYQGVILTPVVGWTTHHSICEFKGKWYLFHHDSKPSGGRTWLRSLKVIELEYLPDGSIKTHSRRAVKLTELTLAGLTA